MACCNSVCRSRQPPHLGACVMLTLGGGGLKTGSVGNGSSPVFPGTGTFDSLTLTGAGAAGVTINMTSAAAGLYFNNSNATNGFFISNVSAANAGATPATSAFKFYTSNALDATDYVFEIGNQSNATRLF